MNANTDSAMESGNAWPPIRNGTTAVGCTSTVISRCDCLTRINERNILMPPPVEPLLTVIQLKKSIQTGANAGHWL